MRLLEVYHMICVHFAEDSLYGAHLWRPEGRHVSQHSGDCSWRHGQVGTGMLPCWGRHRNVSWGHQWNQSQQLSNISGSFVINLRSAESESSDIALHFNPRFTGWDKVVFNSFENDSWGSEEKVRSMPFTKGQPFEIVFMVTTEGYQVGQWTLEFNPTCWSSKLEMILTQMFVQVKIDGQDFYTFSHRIPLERVCAIQIGGQVSIQSIKVLGVRL